jgi:O-antigen/teichoic acid export membrane protein
VTDVSRPTSGATVARGSLWEIAAHSLPQLYVVVSSVFVARFLGAAAMGHVALIVTVQAVVTSLVLLGLPTALSRYVGGLFGAGRGGEARWLVDRVWRYALPGSLAAFTVLALSSRVDVGPRAAWLLAGVTAAGGVLHTVPSSFLMGAQRWREARIVGLSTGLLSMVAKILVVVHGGGVTDLFAVDACIMGLNLVGTWMLALPLLRLVPAVRPERSLRREFMRFANVAAITVGLGLIINQRIEVFFLGHYSTEAAIAHYSVPFSLLVMLLWVPSSISLVFSPAVATLWGAGEIERIRSGFARVVRLSTLVGLVMASFAIAVGGDLVRLVYGPEFAGLRDVVLILALSVPFVPIATLSAGLLKGIGRLWGLTLISATAVVTDLVLAWRLVPAFDAVGAAAANTAAQIVWAIPMLWHARRVLGGVEVGFRLLVPAAIATSAAAIAGFAASAALPVGAGVVAGFAAFAVTLAGATALLHPLPDEDGVWIEALAGDRFRGVVRAASCYARGQRGLLQTREGE